MTGDVSGLYDCVGPVLQSGTVGNLHLKVDAVCHESR